MFIRGRRMSDCRVPLPLGCWVFPLALHVQRDAAVEVNLGTVWGRGLAPSSTLTFASPTITPQQSPATRQRPHNFASRSNQARHNTVLQPRSPTVVAIHYSPQPTRPWVSRTLSSHAREHASSFSLRDRFAIPESAFELSSPTTQLTLAPPLQHLARS
jgi:hypothetical protein